MKKIAVALTLLTLLAALLTPSFAAVRVARTPAPARILVRSTTMRAKVVSVNRTMHTVTLRLPNGTTQTYQVARTADLSRIKAGDMISATLIDMVAVRVQKAGTRPFAARTSRIMLVPAGVGAGRAIAARTYSLTAKIQFIDLKNRTMTVTWPNYKSRTFRIGPGVDLRKFKVGENVNIIFTQAIAVGIHKAAR